MSFPAYIREKVIRVLGLKGLKGDFEIIRGQPKIIVIEKRDEFTLRKAYAKVSPGPRVAPRGARRTRAPQQKAIVQFLPNSAVLLMHLRIGPIVNNENLEILKGLCFNRQERLFQNVRTVSCCRDDRHT